jgi:3'(2'), 5'-bisphosphate nucleotidase
MDELTRIAARAAETILDFVIKPGVRSKADGSPVTAADEAAETIIRDGLKQLAPAVPVISEEHAAREKPKPITGGSYFLVDPLDGTREFIAGRDEYTVNIALMTDGATASLQPIPACPSRSTLGGGPKANPSSWSAARISKRAPEATSTVCQEQSSFKAAHR